MNRTGVSYPFRVMAGLIAVFKLNLVFIPYKGET